MELSKGKLGVEYCLIPSTISLVNSRFLECFIKALLRKTNYDICFYLNRKTQELKRWVTG